MTFPSTAPSWRRYLLFWRRDVEADIDAELQFHLEARVAELTALGLASDDARARALEEFGDVADVRGRLRDIDDRIARRHHRLEWLDGVRQDAAFAVRSLGRTPALAATIVITLALGLGVNAALFSLLDVLYLRPPSGVVHPGGVHRVWRKANLESGDRYWPGFDYPSYQSFRDVVGANAVTATYTWPEKRTLGPDPTGPAAVISFATASYFDIVGARARLGRTFDAIEDRVETPTLVAVISDAFWQRSFDGDPHVLGRTIAVGRRKFIVIGVMPPRFSGTDVDAVDIWAPLSARSTNGFARWWENRNVNGMLILVRPGQSVATAQLEQRLSREWMPPSRAPRAEDVLDQVKLGSIIAARGPGEQDQEVRIAIRLGGVALLVLLIACANVVNLLLARGVRRKREIAVRLALGISRERLLRLLVVESMLLSSVAAFGAIAAAYWGGSVLRAMLLPDVSWASSPIHWRVLLYALVAAIIAGLITGLVPALQSLSPELAGALKSGGREGTVQRSRLRGLLVATQAALSVVLLAGAALFLRSLHNVHAINFGYDADRLVFADVSFPTPDSARDARLDPMLRALADRLRQAPGVERVALSHLQPMNGFSWMHGFNPDADTVAHKIQTPTFAGVAGDYFDAIGLRILRGTGFPSSGPVGQVVVINEALADGLWPGENALGRCIRFDKKADAPCYTVTGIVQSAVRDRVIEGPRPQYYLPLDRMPEKGWPAGSIIVRSDPRVRSAVVAEIRRAVQQTFPGGFPRVTQMTDALEPQFRPWKLGATLFTLFGALALAVAIVGIYSTVSYTVNQRTQEFGVRIALGARVGDVLGLVLGSGLRAVVLGVAAGMALALAAGRFVAALLYGVSPSDPVTLSSVAVVLVVVAAAAALGPAWRAARVDPVTALRAE